MNYKGFRQLKWEDRLRLDGMLRAKAKPKEIAEALGVCVKTVYNEINRGKCMQLTSTCEFVERYSPELAERKYQEHLRAKGPELKIGHDHAFAAYLEDQIVNHRYSPGAVLAQIRAQGLKFQTQICETTLYNYIYRGDVFLHLTREHLLYKGLHRFKHPEKQGWAQLPKGETIERRPEEIRNRGTFGHWEMDSIVGPVGSKAALVTMVERLSRRMLIFRVPDHTMESVVQILNRLERKLGKRFRDIFRSITVDNGCEFQDCAGMEKSLRRRTPRTRIYYCHPYSAYERGSNENGNRMVRRFFPKGTNFDRVSALEVAKVERWINAYPRRILDWKSAEDLFEAHIATA